MQGEKQDALCDKQQQYVPEDLEDLVNLGIAREERLAGTHLGEDAADGPHVNAGGVLASTEQDLRGAVPQSNDLVGVSAQGNTEGARKTKVGQLQVAVSIDQQVLGLQVAVEDAVGVAVADAVAKLPHELLDHGLAEAETTQGLGAALGQSLAAAAVGDGESLHVLLQVEVEELEDEVELVAVGVDNVEEAHDVGVAHLLEEGDFADGGGGDALVLGLEADLLQRHNATAIEEVSGLVDDTVRACGWGEAWSAFVSCERDRSCVMSCRISVSRGV